MNSAERKIFEAEITKSRYGFAHDTASPELLAEPIAEFGGTPMHVLSEPNANPTGGCAINFHAKICDWLDLDRCSQEFARVLDCVRMWKEVAQRQPDFAIVSMFGERLGIIQAPRGE
jgi:hypothetical protein